MLQTDPIKFVQGNNPDVMSKKIFRYLVYIFSVLILLNQLIASFEPGTNNREIPLTLLGLTILSLIGYFLSTDEKQNLNHQPSLFGKKWLFWIASIVMILALLAIYWVLRTSSKPIFPYILTHFSVIALLYIGDRLYKKYYL